MWFFPHSLSFTGRFVSQPYHSCPRVRNGVDLIMAWRLSTQQLLQNVPRWFPGLYEFNARNLDCSCICSESCTSPQHRLKLQTMCSKFFLVLWSWGRQPNRGGNRGSFKESLGEPWSQQADASWHKMTQADESCNSLSGAQWCSC